MHRAVHHAEPATDHYGNAMETPAHARAVCTRPFLLLLKGLVTRLGLVLQVAQWYYSSGVPCITLSPGVLSLHTQ